MFCGSCGTRNPELNRYCRQCGSKLPERPRALSEEAFADLKAPTPPPPVDHAKVAVLMDVAFAYHRDGKLDQAVQTCLEAIALNPESTSAHSLLAVLYEEQGHLDEAGVHLRRVLELNPDSLADQDALRRLLGESTPPRPAPRRAPTLQVPAANRALLAGIGAGAVALVLTMTLVVRALQPSDDGRAKRNAQLAPPQTRPVAPYIPPSANSAPVQPQTPVAPVPQAPVAPTPAPQTAQPQRPAPTPDPAPAPALPRTAPAPPALPHPGQAEEIDAEEGSIEPLPTVAEAPRPGPQGVLVVPRVPVHTPAPSAATLAPTRSAGRDTMDISFAPARGRGDASETRASARPSAAAPRDQEEGAIGQLQKSLDGARSASAQGLIHQQMALAHERAGRTSEAAEEYKKAIARYQAHIEQAKSAEMERAAVRTCEAALRNLGQ